MSLFPEKIGLNKCVNKCLNKYTTMHKNYDKRMRKKILNAYSCNKIKHKINLKTKRGKPQL